MFESVSNILNHYLKVENRELWRFDIYSIQTERGENPEDLYYLCNVRDSWFIVFETDYIFSLEEAAQEASSIFELDQAKVTHWVTKRDEQGRAGALPIESAKDRSNYRRLVLDVKGTYLRCAVLAIETLDPGQKRYDPNVYGYSK